jgi:hypothetical protein
MLKFRSAPLVEKKAHLRLLKLSGSSAELPPVRRRLSPEGTRLSILPTNMRRTLKTKGPWVTPIRASKPSRFSRR